MHKYFIKDYLPLLVSILNFYQREFEPWKSVSNLGECHLYAAHEELLVADEKFLESLFVYASPHVCPNKMSNSNIWRIQGLAKSLMSSWRGNWMAWRRPGIVSGWVWAKRSSLCDRWFLSLDHQPEIFSFDNYHKFIIFRNVLWLRRVKIFWKNLSQD